MKKGKKRVAKFEHAKKYKKMKTENKRPRAFTFCLGTVQIRGPVALRLCLVIC